VHDGAAAHRAALQPQRGGRGRWKISARVCGREVKRRERRAPGRFAEREPRVGAIGQSGTNRHPGLMDLHPVGIRHKAQSFVSLKADVEFENLPASGKC
jgi:hypothetical protein